MLTPPENGEELLRDRILQQEYPFDEQAWDDMEALLDDRNVVANPVSDTWPTPGGSLYKSLALLLIGTAFSLLWFGSKSQSNAATPATGQANSTIPANSTKAGNNIIPPIPESNTPPVQTSSTEAATILDNQYYKPAVNAQNAGQKLNPENRVLPSTHSLQRLMEKGAAPASRPKLPELLPASEQMPQARASEVENEINGIRYSIQNAANQELKTPVNIAEIHAPNTSNSNITADQDASSSIPTKPTPRYHNPVLTPLAIRLQAIQPYPAPEIALKDHPVIPTTPTLIKPNKVHKYQYHVLAGASLAAVDLNELQLRLAPHIGVGVSRVLAPGYRIQAELTGKIIKGYEFQSVLTDTLLLANGVGFRSLNFSGNTLQYLEMPILIKRQSPAHRFNWFAGIRPSVNWSKGASVSAQTYGYFQNALADIDKVPENAELRRGLRRFDLGLVLGVECSISRNLSMNLRFNQGLFDLTHDNFFQARENTLNTDAQLSVQMSF